MAIFRREHFSKHTKVIAVTGSAGKTSTKEMIALSLKNFGTVGATKGNLNNHIGLPLTICNAGNELDFCVLEMGMNHSGEISHLSKIAKPHIAIITNIGAAHLEFFDSIEDIALAKAEIYKGTTNDGWAIINEDNLYKDILKQQALLHKLNILTFGKDSNSDIKLVSYETINHKTKVKVSAFGEELSYFFNTIIGKHLIINSLASIAVAKILDLDIKSAINNLIVFKPIEGRGNASMLKNGMILIDESYNANPESVKASIISMINHKAKNNRLILVLGDMRELGKESKKIHAELAAHIENIDLVYTVGEMMLEMHRELPQNIIGAHVDTAEEMAKIIINDLKDNDVILVKGSFSMNMITIVNSILKDFSE
jgi:UDP-N-acetylmuramoyl-tripeptide--D-alanyl-D-alanine ligase